MNKRLLTLSVVGLLAGLAMFGATGCTVSAMTPSVVVAPAPPPPVAVVVQPAPPARVYYGGHWLHYRSDGYYYYQSGSWVVARSVPTHVSRYHHPTHVTHVTHVRQAPPHRTRVVHQSGHRVRHY